MSVIKRPEEVEKIKSSARLLATCLDLLVKEARPGVSAFDLNKLAEEFILDNGAIPAFKNYRTAKEVRPFPGSICFSRNDVLVHGIPTEEEILEEGDILTIDCGLSLDGWFADAARLFGIGEISLEDRNLLDATHTALAAGVEKCRPGYKLGAVSNSIQASIAVQGYHNVLNFCGHAIGRNLHEEPPVPNFGLPEQGIELVPGMVFCLEPVLLKNSTGIGVLPDQWSIVSLDGSRGAHIEHMVLVAEEEPEVLT